MASTKTCRKCGESKPLAAFTRNPSARDGVRNQCKSCQAAYLRDWRETNPEKSRAQDRRYYERHGRRPTQDVGDEAHRAHQAVERAVRAGRLVKPAACERCSITGERIEGHHEDYGQPLVVEWLCARCHRRHHADEAVAA